MDFRVLLLAKRNLNYVWMRTQHLFHPLSWLHTYLSGHIVAVYHLHYLLLLVRKSLNGKANAHWHEGHLLPLFRRHLAHGGLNVKIVQLNVHKTRRLLGIRRWPESRVLDQIFLGVNCSQLLEVYQLALRDPLLLLRLGLI